MNISKLKQNPKVFSRVFGIKPDKFNELVLKIEPLWKKAEEKRLNHPRKIKSGKRIIIEHVFALIKSYRILADRFRGHLENYNQYFLIVCGLCNFARF